MTLQIFFHYAKNDVLAAKKGLYWWVEQLPVILSQHKWSSVLTGTLTHPPTLGFSGCVRKRLKINSENYF
jgi:hypothetical protein